MATGDDLDDDPAILDPLDGLITGVDRELLANGFLDRDLAALAYSTGYGRYQGIDSYHRCPLVSVGRARLMHRVFSPWAI